MIDGGPREEEQRERDDERARALQRLLPPLVHRLNSALFVLSGVLELGARAGATERGLAQSEVESLGRALGRLVVLARRPAAREEVLDLCATVRDADVLLRPLAESLGLRLELRLCGSLPVRAEAGLEGSLVVLVTELLAALAAAAPCSLRVTVRPARGRGMLALAARGVTLDAAAERQLQLRFRAPCVVRSRRSGRALGLHLSFPVPEDARVESLPFAPRPRVLLLHSPGEERELAGMLLREHGCQVTEDTRVPGGDFQLALVEGALSRREPALLAALRSRTSLRVELLEPPLLPARLLDLIRS